MECRFGLSFFRAFIYKWAFVKIFLVDKIVLLMQISSASGQCRSSSSGNWSGEICPICRVPLSDFCMVKACGDAVLGHFVQKLCSISNTDTFRS